MCDDEESEDGVGVGVNTTMLSGTLAVISLAESTEGCFGSEKNPYTVANTSSHSQNLPQDRFGCEKNPVTCVL